LNDAQRNRPAWPARANRVATPPKAEENNGLDATPAASFQAKEEILNPSPEEFRQEYVHPLIGAIARKAMNPTPFGRGKTLRGLFPEN
jgi:hypothetical protein